MDVGCTLDLDYELRLWAPTSASRAISAVAELLVYIVKLHIPKALVTSTKLLGYVGDASSIQACYENPGLLTRTLTFVLRRLENTHFLVASVLQKRFVCISD